MIHSYFQQSNDFAETTVPNSLETNPSFCIEHRDTTSHQERLNDTEFNTDNMNHLHKPRRFAFRFRNQKPRHIRLSVWKAAIRWLWRQLFMGCLLQTILHGILYLSAHVLGSAHVGGVLMGRGCNPGLCTEVC